MKTSVVRSLLPASHWQAALSWCALSLGAKREDLVEIQLCGGLAAEAGDEGGIVFGFEPLDAERVAALLGGFGEIIPGAEDELLAGFQRVGAEAHHDGIEVARARIEMAAARVKVEQMQVIHDDHRMRVERVEEQAVKGFLQRKRMGFGRGLDEVLHVQEGPAGLFVHFLAGWLSCPDPHRPTAAEWSRVEGPLSGSQMPASAPGRDGCVN